MGKKQQKGRKYRLRQKQWNIARHQHEDYLRYTVELDDSKENYKKYYTEEAAKEIGNAVKELRSRTVFVSQVKDLNKTINAQHLKLFLEREYGPVEKLLITNDSNRISGQGISRRRRRKSKRNHAYQYPQFPRARVRFVTALHAQKIFGGRSLLDLDPKTNTVDVRCATAGYRGFLKIQPSESHASIYLDDVATSTKIEFTANDVAVGHWIPARKDSYIQLFGDEADVDDEDEHELITNFNDMDKFERKRDEWLEEARVGDECKVVLDLGLRTLEIQAADGTTGVFCLVVDFKWMLTHMDICQDRRNRISLVFSLSQCPILESLKQRNHGFPWMENSEWARERVLRFGSILGKTFARCRGIRLAVNDSVLTRLQLSPERIEKLKEFGLVSRHVMRFEPDIDIVTRNIGDSEAVEPSLRSISNPTVGK
jgi:hypothetical protein